MTSVKQRRRTITLATKLDILRRFDSGERAVDISRTLDIPQSTVKCIRSSAEKIKASEKSATPSGAARLTRIRSATIERVEKLLSVWIDDHSQRGVPLSASVIQAKALSLFKDVQTKEGVSSEAETFTASRGWLHRFKQRYYYRSIKVKSEAASADVDAAEKFAQELKTIIEEGGYSSKQVFNVDETGLFWKKMPSRTYISSEEKRAPGFKAERDRLTLLLGGNAAGDMKMKPLLVYHSANPRALKGYSKDHLPVIWRHNKKARITGKIFCEWLSVYAIPAWKEYCAQQNIDFKILLLIDCAPSHPTNLDDLCENIKIVFLPPGITTSVQPMEQGAIAAFKAYYLRHLFVQLITATDGEDKPTIRFYWRAYNILHSLDNIKEAWASVNAELMNCVWFKLWPECVAKMQVDDNVSSINEETLQLAKVAGFDDLEKRDVEEVLESHEEELTNEELMELEEHKAELQEDDDSDPEPQRTLTLNRMSEAFKNVDAALEIFCEDDPNRERSSRVCHQVANVLLCYREIFNEKKKKASASHLK